MGIKSDKLDNLDMKILSKLLNNCRESDRQIGKELGISGGAARARVSKMEKLGIIEEFTIRIEPPVLGYGVLYFVVTGQDMNEILEQVSLVGEPVFVIPCIGGITVCSIVVQENLEQKIELAKQIMKDVRVLSIFEAENPGYPSNLTKTDLEIVEKLIDDPRGKIESIAKSAKLSTKTVTRCLEKLQKNEGIQFTLVYDPTKIQGFIPYAILTQIRGNLKDTLDEMNEEFFESYMQTPFLSKNQIVLFMYSKDIFEMDTITHKVRNSKNVISADLFIPKKISFLQNWLKNSINEAKKSPTLHLTYQTK